MPAPGRIEEARSRRFGGEGPAGDDEGVHVPADDKDAPVAVVDRGNLVPAPVAPELADHRANALRVHLQFAQLRLEPEQGPERKPRYEDERRGSGPGEIGRGNAIRLRASEQDQREANDGDAGVNPPQALGLAPAPPVPVPDLAARRAVFD